MGLCDVLTMSEQKCWPSAFSSYYPDTALRSLLFYKHDLPDVRAFVRAWAVTLVTGIRNNNNLNHNTPQINYSLLAFSRDLLS